MRNEYDVWSVGPEWGMLYDIGIGMNLWGHSERERERWASLTDDEREAEEVEYETRKNIRWTRCLFQAIHDSLFYGQADDEIATWPRQVRRRLSKMTEKERLSYWLKSRNGYNQ